MYVRWVMDVCEVGNGCVHVLIQVQWYTPTFPSDFMACSADPSAPTVVFVSKLFSVEKSALPQHQNRLGRFDTCASVWQGVH